VSALSTIAGIAWSIAAPTLLVLGLLSAVSIVAGEDPAFHGAAIGLCTLFLAPLLFLSRRRARAFRRGQIAGLVIMAVAVPTGVWWLTKRLPTGLVRPRNGSR